MVAQRYRSIAMDQRYFGTTAWSDHGAQVSQATHVADLAAFIRALQAGPVHLVGRSYGAAIVLTTALRHPELVRSVLAREPSISSLVTDEATQKVVREDRQGFAAVRAAAKAGDAVQATKLLHEFVNDQPGAFDALRPEVKAMHLDNARPVPLQMSATAPAPLSYAELRRLNVPLTITKGELTRASFKALAEAAHGCIPGAQLVTIPQARHGAIS